jgi:hypothetical protein
LIRATAPASSHPSKFFSTEAKKNEAATLHKRGRMCQKEKPKMSQYFSIRQVADRLGVAFYRVKFAHQAGHVQEPLRVGNTRFYAEDDIRRLERYFSNRSTHIYDKPGRDEEKTAKPDRTTKANENENTAK